MRHPLVKEDRQRATVASECDCAVSRGSDASTESEIFPVWALTAVFADVSSSLLMYNDFHGKTDAKRAFTGALSLMCVVLQYHIVVDVSVGSVWRAKETPSCNTYFQILYVLFDVCSCEGAVNSNVK